jgi:uncharacterized membrane protein YesL
MWRVSDDFLEQIDYWASFIMVNLLWVLCAIPLVTLPAATAGLFAVTARMSQGEAPNVFSTFFGAMRTHWKTSTGLAVLNIAVIALIAVNLSIFPMMSGFNPMAILSRSVTLFVTLLLVMVNGYAWPLLVTRELALRPLLTTALQMVFAMPLHSVGVLLALCLPFGISIFLPAAALVLITFSCAAYAINAVAGRALKRAA